MGAGVGKNLTTNVWDGEDVLRSELRNVYRDAMRSAWERADVQVHQLAEKLAGSEKKLRDREREIKRLKENVAVLTESKAELENILRACTSVCNIAKSEKMLADASQHAAVTCEQMQLPLQMLGDMNRRLREEKSQMMIKMREENSKLEEASEHASIQANTIQQLKGDRIKFKDEISQLRKELEDRCRELHTALEEAESSKMLANWVIKETEQRIERVENASFLKSTNVSLLRSQLVSVYLNEVCGNAQELDPMGFVGATRATGSTQNAGVQLAKVEEFLKEIEGVSQGYGQMPVGTPSKYRTRTGTQDTGYWAHTR
jgi:chromosome segregation ATPase